MNHKLDQAVLVHCSVKVVWNINFLSLILIDCFQKAAICRPLALILFDHRIFSNLLRIFAMRTFIKTFKKFFEQQETVVIVFRVINL